MIDIALVGAGQLGSRHLQSLAQFDRPATIWVVDPSAQSLAVARERFEQVAREPVTARFVQGFDELPRELAAAVVATGANVRRVAVEALLAHSSVRVMLLEKVLFQRVADYAAIGTLLETRGVKAWVNCAQRLWPFFAQLRERTIGQSNVHISVSGANWGLGCNAIHNLDLLGFMTGETVDRIEAALDHGSVPSKRPEFIEFTGTLSCYGIRGNSVVQTSYRAGTAPFEFAIQAEDFRATWRVSDGVALISEASDGWAWQHTEWRVPMQSQLTQGLVAKMIDGEASVLPTYDESAVLHVSMINSFLAHLGSGADGCSIT